MTNLFLVLLTASCLCCLPWPEAASDEAREPSESARLLRQMMLMQSGSANGTSKANPNTDFAARLLQKMQSAATAGGTNSSSNRSTASKESKSGEDFTKSYLTHMQEVAGGDEEYRVQYEIFVFRNYKGMAAPSTSQMLVQLQVSPLQLTRQQQNQDDITAQVALTQVWQDSRLRFSNAKVTEVFVYTHFLDRLWKPRVQFVTAGPVSGVTAIIREDGSVRLTQRVTVSLACSSQLHLLPLDQPSCSAALCNSRATESQQRLEWLPSNASDWPVGSQLGDSILADVRLLGRRAAPGLTLQLRLRRRLALFLLGVHAPGACLAVLAACGLRAGRPGHCAACAAAAFLLWLLVQQTYPQAPVHSLLSLWLLGCCGLTVSASFAASLPSGRRRHRGGDGGEASPLPPKDDSAADSPLMAKSPTAEVAAAAAADAASTRPRGMPGSPALTTAPGGRRRCLRTGLLTLYVTACVACLALYSTAAVVWTTANAASL